MTTGSGGSGVRNPQSFTRVVARTVRPARNDIGQNHRPSQRVPSGSAQGDTMQGVYPPQATLDDELRREISNEPGPAGQPYQLSAEAELSLFLEGDDSMNANNRDEDNGDVLGWDVDMDHTVIIRQSP